MASIVSQTIVVIVNTVLSEGSVNWPRVRRCNLRVTKTKGYGMRAERGSFMNGSVVSIFYCLKIRH